MNRRTLRRLVPVLLAFAWTLAQAQPKDSPKSPKVFRCTDAKGSVIYTDKPEVNCKTVRVDPPPASRLARPAPVAKPLPASKARTVTQAPAPRTQKTHCAAISKAAGDLAAGKRGGLDAAAAAHREAGVRKELSENCS